MEREVVELGLDQEAFQMGLRVGMFWQNAHRYDEAHPRAGFHGSPGETLADLPEPLVRAVAEQIGRDLVVADNGDRVLKPRLVPV